jgi:hypothetical protein
LGQLANAQVVGHHSPKRKKISVSAELGLEQFVKTSSGIQLIQTKEIILQE